MDQTLHAPATSSVALPPRLVTDAAGRLAATSWGHLVLVDVTRAAAPPAALAALTTRVALCSTCRRPTVAAVAVLAAAVSPATPSTATRAPR